MTSLTNTTYAEIKIGQSITVSRQLSKMDIEALAFTSGDVDAYQLGNGDSGEGPHCLPADRDAPRTRVAVECFTAPTTPSVRPPGCSGSVERSSMAAPPPGVRRRIERPPRA